ncbi:MAG: hypothetical protein WD004_04525 [Actinomycetota bacterium]
MSETDSGQPPRQGFFRDLGSALAVWARFPALPLITMSLAVGTQLTGMTTVLFLPTVVLATAGVTWMGVERSWYVAAWRGERVAVRDVTEWMMLHFWPFVRLVMLMGIVMVPAIVLSVIAANAGGQGRSTARITLLISSLALDVALTFGIPALALRTSRVWSAMKIGMVMIAATWPGCLIYLLVPPLVVHLVIFASGPTVQMPLLVGVGAVTTLVRLAFDGAVARFYARSEHLVIDLEEWDKAATEGQTPQAR